MQQVGDIQSLGAAVAAVAAGGVGNGILHALGSLYQNIPLSVGQGIQMVEGLDIVGHLGHVGHAGQHHGDVIKAL